jgi:hypothetical protein
MVNRFFFAEYQAIAQRFTKEAQSFKKFLLGVTLCLLDVLVQLDLGWYLSR